MAIVSMLVCMSHWLQAKYIYTRGCHSLLFANLCGWPLLKPVLSLFSQKCLEGLCSHEPFPVWASLSDPEVESGRFDSQVIVVNDEPKPPPSEMEAK